MSYVENRLLRVFQVAFPSVPATDLQSATAESLEAWDSLTTVTLVNLVQEEFGVELPPNQAMTLVSFAGFRAALDQVTGK